MSIVVAGGTGFVGSAVVRELARRREPVVALSRHPERAAARVPAGVELRRADVAASTPDAGPALTAALAGADALVIALAFDGMPMEKPSRGRTFEAVDAAGTERLAAAAKAAGVSRLVYVSGAGAAPDARYHWFRAKWRAETAVRESGITFTIVRPTWVYGPGDAALNRFLGFARWLPFVPLTNDGRQLLAPVFIDDIGRLVVDALSDPAAADRTFELGGPETFEMNQIVRAALRAAGRRRPLLHGPTRLVKLAAWPLSFLPRPPLTPAAVDFINQPATVDIGPLLAAMPRRLTPLEEGLATYLPRRKDGRAGQAEPVDLV
ncbi:MAG: NAD(P)H-binding protein [Candidatus Limnocylindrales bacterium]